MTVLDENASDELGSDGDELRMTRLQVGTDEYLALSFPPVEISAPPGLTASEQVIFRALLAGQSNQAIATARRRSLRTIANQVAAVFQKLQVSSRVELIAKCAGPVGVSA